MKKTKVTKALLKALLASYNSYINNKKGWTPKEVQPFFYSSTFFIIRRITPSLWGKGGLSISLFTLICILIKPPHHMC